MIILLQMHYIAIPSLFLESLKTREVTCSQYHWLEVVPPRMQRQLHNLIVLTTYSIIPHYVKTDYGRKSTPLHQRGTHVDLMVMQRSCSSCRDMSVYCVSPARELATMPALLTSESV